MKGLQNRRRRLIRIAPSAGRNKLGCPKPLTTTQAMVSRVKYMTELQIMDRDKLYRMIHKNL